MLTERQTNDALLLFAFIPARYDFSLPLGEAWPGGFGADVWTFVTYAFLHGDLNHLGVQLGMASGFRLAGGAPVRNLAVSCILRRNRRPVARSRIS